MAGFSDLPQELVAKILALLPADSLMQSKCVQKSWYSIITNPRFVVQQLRNQIYMKNGSVLLKGKALNDSGEAENVLSLLSFDYKTVASPGEDHVSAVEKVVDIPSIENRRFYEFLGHCHGIICLASPPATVILANPATKEFRELPKSCNHPPRGLDVGWLPFRVGFGYDPKGNDYKVVRFMSWMGRPGFVPPTWVEVYTLSTDSWRKLNNMDLFGSKHSYIQDHCRYINGACYRLAWGDFDEKQEDFILSFNTSEEVFRKIPIPDTSDNNGERFSRLMVLNESLAFALHDSHRSQHSLEIWVMDECGVNSTWKKLWTIGTNSRLKWLILFQKKMNLSWKTRMESCATTT